MFQNWSSRAITLLATMLLSPCIGSLWAQDFREPNVPGGIEYISPGGGMQINGVFQPQDIPAPDSSSPGFVPKASNEGLGMVPVRPREGSPSTQDFQTLRPDYPQGRSEEEARILEQMRAGNFDNTPAVNGPVRSDQGHQIIRQRYSDGKVQLMRQVAQDEAGNYFNDGPWQLFNKRGELMASGQFINGLMDGRWERWHAANSTGMFRTRPFTEFEGPFVSTATFKAGKLDGTWSISDRNQRTIVEVPYVDGKRNGTASWSFPNSQTMRTVNFKNGLLDGPLQEWDEKNQLVRNDEYIAGQKVIRVTSMFRPEQKSAETFFLDSQLELDGQDNWWDAEPAEFAQKGDRVQHGPSFAWHSNGQRKMAGQYLNNQRVGLFSWWHENGTQALAGRYDQGRKQGRWTWWHDNGMKSIEGDYANDIPNGPWTWWDEAGQIRSQEDFGDDSKSSGDLVDPADTKSLENSAESNAESEPETQLTNPPSTGIPEMEEIRPVDDLNTEGLPAFEDEDQEPSESGDESPGGEDADDSLDGLQMQDS